LGEKKPMASPVCKRWDEKGIGPKFEGEQGGLREGWQRLL